VARILVVDDELDIVRMVAHVLGARGHQIESGRDAVDAALRIRRAPPDLVIIDVDLPGTDGNELCRRLKADPASRAVPVLMMTAGDITLDDCSREAGPGADGWLVKPFVREVLVANVDRLLPSGS
jgi:DNA-binding response OmpR family regulator